MDSALPGWSRKISCHQFIQSDLAIGLFLRLPASYSSDFMPRKSSLPTLLVLLAGLLLAALVPLLSAGLSASHDPLREVSAHTERHAEIWGLDQDAAPHDHDGGSTGGDHGGHSHGHSHGYSAVDHFHESLFVLPEHATPFCTGITSWRYCPGIGRTGAVVAVPERPPRPSIA